MIPQCPRFVIGDIDYTFELPARPWLPIESSVGGSETAAGGIAASYEVREDALLSITLRFEEEEWLDVRDLVRAMQAHAGTTAVYLDADDFEPTNSCYLEEPARGTRWGPERTDGMAGEFELTILLRSMTGPWAAQFFIDELES